jgi:hypothetical protein
MLSEEEVMMGFVRKLTTVSAAALVLLGLGATRAPADILLGNGKADSNCYAGLEVGDTTGATITEGTKSTELSCVDGTACDLDGACNGECLFEITPCINVAGVEGCTAPGTLDSLKAKGNVTGVKGASGKIVIDTSQLLEGSVCGAFLVQVEVPLKGKNLDKSGKAKVKLDAKAPKGTKPRKDKDKFDLVCEPAPEGCGSASGAFLD